jgi:hypothetical protein
MLEASIFKSYRLSTYVENQNNDYGIFARNNFLNFVASIVFESSVIYNFCLKIFRILDAEN